MINVRVGDDPVMFAYELLARCKHLTLSGIDEDGELEWIGTLADWNKVSRDEEQALL